MIQTILVPERLDSVKSLQFDKEVEPIADTNKYIILDFSECDYLASMGIRVIVKTKKTLLKKSGDLYLVGVKPLIISILELSGIKSIIKIMDSEKDVLSDIEKLSKPNDNCCYLTAWTSPTLASYEDLQFAVGIGSAADDINPDTNGSYHFISTGYCSAFLKSDQPELNDFRIAEHPDKAGIYLSSALSFGSAPTTIFSIDSEELSMEDVIAKITSKRISLYPNSLNDSLYVIKGTHTGTPSITIVLVKNDASEAPYGCTFTLEEWHKADASNIYSKSINSNLTLENIIGIDEMNRDMKVSSVECGLFCPTTCRDSKDTRLIIQSEEPLDLYKEFLARRIYTDSACIEINKLHGGFSAQTYQVTSYDEHHRKLRPTVMKIAGKEMIERESSNCINNALPYIMNNSAQVIGTEFFADMGALRYNFVGIGGNNSQIKWLTDYYLNQPFASLKPLFDKIFTKILNPWYGQVVEKDINPYSEHDPTTTFFPHIYDTANKEFGINCDDQFIYIEEIGKELTNPYYFLKYEYTSRRDVALKYFSCICHGDLNMQNILIDESQNVYLIDFSETKMRCAISDFARLEAVMLVDNSLCGSEEEYNDYSKFIYQLYNRFNSLDSVDVLIGQYKGRNEEWVEKNIQLVSLLRHYAINCVKGDNNPTPYYFSFLEWCLPIICYVSLSHNTKRLSMVISAIIIDKIKGLK